MNESNYKSFYFMYNYGNLFTVFILYDVMVYKVSDCLIFVIILYYKIDQYLQSTWYSYKRVATNTLRTCRRKWTI